MKKPSEYKYTYQPELSDEEYKALQLFLAYYRNQKVIVADKYRIDSNIVPFEHERAIFIKNPDHWKSLDFRRQINVNGKTYIVDLGLWRVGHASDDPTCLSLEHLAIYTKHEKHEITFNTGNALQKNLLFSIISTFDENKIVSPWDTYSSRMHPDQALQGFIQNGDWGKIREGLNQEPSLANDLFLTTSSYSKSFAYNGNFSTILFQLISFRQVHAKELSKKELDQLDRLILRLRKTDLLQVKLYESFGAHTKTFPTGTPLIKMYTGDSKMRIAEQMTPENTELDEEKSTLNRVIRYSELTR